MKRKLKKELRQVRDDACLLNVTGKRNGWGLSLELDARGTFHAFGWRIKQGDVIRGALTGDRFVVVTEARRTMDPDDMTLGRWACLSPEAAAVVLEREPAKTGIVGLL